MYKPISGIILLLVLSLSVSGQDTRTIDLEPFNKIKVSSEIDAELVLAKEPSLEIDFKAVDPAMLLVEVEDETLTLRMKTGNYEKGSLKVKIFFTDLIKVESSGRASIWSYEEIIVPGLEINLDNGGSIRLKILTDHLQSELIQGSILMLKGKAKTLNLKVSTGATFSAFEFQVEEADVLANSAGKAKIAVSKNLTAKAVSGGFISYIGEPEKLDTKTSLKGEIIKGSLDE